MKPDKIFFDARALAQRAAAPFWNAIHDAIVTEVTDAHVLVRVNELEVSIPKSEWTGVPELGASVSIYLGDPGDKPTGSLVAAAELRQMAEIDAAVAKKEEVSGFMVGPIKGGYAVALLAANRDEADRGEGLRAFLPTSQIGYAVPQGVATFVVKEFDPASGNIIVSRRSIANKERRVAEKLFFETRKAGDIVTGTVVNLVPYGAFVDVGGAVALLHLSDMSWDKHPAPHETVKVGLTREFQILEIDQKAKKLKVGLKQLLPDPWKTLEGQYQPGSDVEGDVVALADFGAFLHIANGIEGLIHLSEISWQRIKHPSHRFKLGDHVTARVLSVDKDGHRISLSTKALEQNPIEKLAAQFPVGAVLKTRIAEVRDYGVLVDLDENIQGLVHIGELSWTKRVEHPSELYKEGDEVEIVVLGFDSDRQRVSCSIKRTQPDPWLVWRDKFAKGTRHEVAVSRIGSHGAECDLDKGLVGFCPTKELSAEAGASARPQDLVKIGQTISVEVTQCEPQRNSITLSVRARAQKETREDYAQYLSRQSQDSGKMTLGDIVHD